MNRAAKRIVKGYVLLSSLVTVLLAGGAFLRTWREIREGNWE